MIQIGVVGAGAWGTALAAAAARAGNNVLVYARESEVVESINTSQENSVFLKGMRLPAEVKATSDIAALKRCGLLLLVPPAQYMDATCAALKSAGIGWDTRLVICSKGVEKRSLRLMHEVVRAHLHENPIFMLSGPTFADEVARGQFTAATLAGGNALQVADVIHALQSETFRLHASHDLVGAEIGGSIKNVIAVACGIARGLGLGENAKAAAIVQGLREMKLLVSALGGHGETVTELCGMGDLILTCSSEKSRNTSFGMELGRGAKATEILANLRTVAEGAESSASIAALAHKHSLHLTLCQFVEAVITGTRAASEMTRVLAQVS